MYRISAAKAPTLSIALVGVAVVIALLVANGSGSADDPLKVDVFAKQYSWSFDYPGEEDAFVEGEMHVPLGREVEFEMHSDDVVHGFWVPEWRLKEEVPPATTTTASFTPDKAGTYELICTEACGILHLDMRAKVVVEPPAAFRKWVDGLRRPVPTHLRELIRQDRELGSIRKTRKAGV
jgi:heme/copper-type cytochrome/quinol oxidase subunit 2